MKNKIKTAFKLFALFFKIGLFTFGGGYAMIALIQKEFAEKRKLISEEDLLEIIAIAESTPGPIAINSATYIGFSTCGVLGAFFATLGVVLPSFIIILIISLFFDQFMQITIVQNAFKGVQVAVGILIVSAGIKMFKKVKKTPFCITIFVITLIIMTLIDVFVWNFSSIYIILIGGVCGLLFYGIALAAENAKKKKVAALQIEKQTDGEEKENLSLTRNACENQNNDTWQQSESKESSDVRPQSVSKENKNLTRSELTQNNETNLIFDTEKAENEVPMTKNKKKGSKKTSSDKEKEL